MVAVVECEMIKFKNMTRLCLTVQHVEENPNTLVLIPIAPFCNACVRDTHTRTYTLVLKIKIDEERRLVSVGNRAAAGECMYLTTDEITSVARARACVRACNVHAYGCKPHVFWRQNC